MASLHCHPHGLAFLLPDGPCFTVFSFWPFSSVGIHVSWALLGSFCYEVIQVLVISNHYCERFIHCVRLTVAGGWEKEKKSGQHSCLCMLLGLCCWKKINKWQSLVPFKSTQGTALLLFCSGTSGSTFGTFTAIFLPRINMFLHWNDEEMNLGHGIVFHSPRRSVCSHCYMQL